MTSNRYKCLIVDDDPLIGDLIKHFCTKSSLVEYCILSSTARDGLMLLTSGDIDLVFLDYNLPDMNGQTFLFAGVSSGYLLCTRR